MNSTKWASHVFRCVCMRHAIPLVETTNATLGGTLSNQTINDLPLNGRNYINLLTLRPGMNIYPGGGGSTRSANGTRTEDIGYLLEGLREDDPYTGSSVLNAAIAAGDSSTSLPIDAIQEFNTEQNVKAEYGWKPGAIVNAGLKSGSNTIHGTAFMFGRTTALDARNFFNADVNGKPACANNPAPCVQAPIGLKQYGASFGVPIKKDHFFYFVNYEGQHYSAGSTFYTIPPLTVTAPGGPKPKSKGREVDPPLPFFRLVNLAPRLQGSVMPLATLQQHSFQRCAPGLCIGPVHAN